MTTYQLVSAAPGAVQSRAHLSKTGCTRMSHVSLRKGEGRVRVPLDSTSWWCKLQPLTSILSPSPTGEATETD